VAFFVFAAKETALPIAAGCGGVQGAMVADF